MGDVRQTSVWLDEATLEEIEALKSAWRCTTKRQVIERAIQEAAARARKVRP